MPTLPDRSLIGCRMPARFVDDLDALAHHRGETRSAVLRELLRRGLDAARRRGELPSTEAGSAHASG